MLEDLHSPLQHKEISRYHFYDLPVHNGQVIKLGDRVSAAVLPCPHQTPEVVMLVRDNVRLQVTCSGTGTLQTVDTLDTLVWKAGPILIAATACAGSFPAFRPQLSTALITIDHCKSSYKDNIQRWYLAI